MSAPGTTAELSARRAQGHMRFGFCVPAFAAPGPDLFRTPNLVAVDAVDALRSAVDAEALGFDSVWVCDHLMLGREKAVLEGWTTLSAIAGATKRIRLGLIHQANLFRHPAIAAKMIATLDALSAGRFTLFVEPGTLRAEHVAYGLDWDEDAARRVERLEEALRLIAQLLGAVEPIEFRGRHYRLDGAMLAPKPVQRPAPPLWFGEAAPAVLDLCARVGTGWNSTPVPLDELAARLRALDAALARAGRSRAEIEVSLETQILVAEDLPSLRRKVEGLAERSREAGAGEPRADIADFIAGRVDHLPDWVTGPWIVGTPETVRDRLGALRRLGVDHLLLWFMDAPERGGMQLFLAEPAKGFR